nr:ribonuclease H-like domain, reverse transcriptase, RNA-dependent DNA polymerase [Tanacetum cinerariifolium]
MHEAENKTEEGEQVYGLMAGIKSDFTDHVGNATGSVYDAAAEFAMMGISPKVQTCPFRCDSKLSELKKNYNHLEKLYNDSFIQVQAYKNTVNTLELQKDWYHRTQLALEEKVRILSANLENTTNTLKYTETLYDQAKIEKKEWEVKLVESLSREVKSLYERFVKAGEMREVPPPIIGTFMPTSYKSDLEETHETFSSKSNTSSINTSESNDFVSCDNSDKSSESETSDFASCVSRPKTNDSSSTIDVKILPKSNVKDPSPTNGIPSCSFNENVKPPRNLCNKSGIADRIHCKNNFVRTKTCFVCGSKTHLIKDCDVFNKPAPFPAGRSVPTGWTNHAARPFFRPTNLYFDNVFWPRIYDHMSMNEGRWGSAVKSSAGYPKLDGFHFPCPFWNEKWLVQGGTTLELASLEQTATGKDVSNPFMAVMVCQKPLGYFSSPMIHVPRAGLVIHPPG